MTCTNCGKALPEGAMFCDGCGAKQTAPVTPVAETPAAPAAPAAPVAPVIINNTTPKKRVVSPGGYIARSLFLLIPIAGWLVYFIMLFVWASNDEAEDSFRNWAKAQLWLILIFVCIVAVIAAFVLIAGVNLFAMLR